MIGTTLGKFTAYFLTALIAFFSPILWAFWIVIIFVVVDTVFGIMRAGKQDVKDIKSRKLFALVTKLIAYLLLVVLAHAIGLVEPKIPFVKLCLFGIGFIEVKSIDENFRGIFGYSFIDKILSALKFVKEFKRKGNK